MTTMMQVQREVSKDLNVALGDEADQPARFGYLRGETFFAQKKISRSGSCDGESAWIIPGSICSASTA